MSKIEEAGQRARNYHESGFHCAEAVSQAIVELYGHDGGPYIPMAATAFGGGLGRSSSDLCGAVSGAVLAVGWLYGRREPGRDWQGAADLAARLRQRFLAEHGTTNCGDLLAAFGPQDNMDRCKRLSGEVAAMLAEILEE